MSGVIAALFQHPIKGFTPQAVTRARLEVGGPFPGDRLYALEVGPSGFDRDSPRFISKRHFAVLAHLADVARARTHYDCETGRVTASAAGFADFTADLASGVGRSAFAAWIQAVLGAAATAPLKVLEAPGYRFLDHPLGHVSILNLASLADLERRLGRTLDPARLRANVHVEGWPAWAENGWKGRELRLGAAHVRVFEPIVRCAAPNVNPTTAVCDVDFTAEMHRLYGHLLFGVYVHIEKAGVIAPGDAALAPEAAEAQAAL